MAVKLLFTVMDSNLYKSHPRLKILLMSLCNFSDEFGKGKMWNSTMARHIGTGEEQVRRYKRILEKDGICDFKYKAGKGSGTQFKLDLVHIDRLVNRTSGYDEIEPNITPPVGGVSNDQTPPLTALTPPVDPKNPTSSSGVKRERTIKGASASRLPRIELESLTAYWRQRLTKELGAEWIKSWLIDEQIFESPKGVVLTVKNAFAKSRVEKTLETLSGADALNVMVLRKAPA